MRICRWLCSCLTIMLVVLLAAPLFGRDRRKSVAREPIQDVEATVLSLRRYQLGTYVEVMRADGKHEWLMVSDEEGMEVRVGQRVAYTTEDTAIWNASFGSMLRHGAGFRILQLQRDDRVFQGVGPDGTTIFTDTPSAEMSPQETATGVQKHTGTKKRRGEEPLVDEVVVVDPEEEREKEAMMNELYRYAERANTQKPVRKAKRAKPRLKEAERVSP